MGDVCNGKLTILSGRCFLLAINNYTLVRCYNEHISNGFTTFVFKLSFKLCSFAYIRETLVTRTSLHSVYIPIAIPIVDLISTENYVLKYYVYMFKFDAGVENTVVNKARVIGLYYTSILVEAVLFI